MVSDEVDAVLEQPLQAELVRQLEHRHAVGHVQVPDHELDTSGVQLLRLQIVGGLQQVLSQQKLN